MGQIENMGRVKDSEREGLRNREKEGGGKKKVRNKSKQKKRELGKTDR